MSIISHEFEYNVSTSKVFSSLISGEQIAKWWTSSAILEPTIGAIGTFKWPSHGWTVKMKLQKLDKSSYVEWSCIESNMQNTNAWEGTVLKFLIQDNNKKTRLQFVQEGYESSPCRNICNDGWAYVLGNSLKTYLESGAGSPHSD